MPHHAGPLLEALKVVAVTLGRAQVPYALAGGFAVYARGGQCSTNDVDFVVPEAEVAAAREALAHEGLEILTPPEDWLFKARHAGSPVDVIFRLPTGPVEEDLLRRCDRLSVESVAMPVLSATDLVLAKLLAMTAHSCDLEPVMAVLRSLREQLDPQRIAAQCRGRPYAEAALFLAHRLGVLDIEPAAEGPIDLNDRRWEPR